MIRFIRRNLLSISFPLLTATLIYIDWSHTKTWKLPQREQK